MESKKNPNANLNTKRPLLLMVGLIASLSLTLMAFEWKTYGAGDLMDLGNLEDPFEEILDVPITEIPPPEKPVIKQPQIIEVPDEEELEEDIEIEIDVDVDEEEVIDDIVIDELEEEVAEDIFVLAPEISASFPGGEQAWARFLKKNFKYPKSAQRMGIEGRVFLRFIVDKDGNVSDIQVTRGIGGGCDEEAMRVLQNSPRWNPGKQRGRPVKSPMAISILFRLK